MGHGFTFSIATIVGPSNRSLVASLGVGNCQKLVEAGLLERDGPTRSWEPYYGFLGCGKDFNF